MHPLFGSLLVIVTSFLIPKEAFGAKSFPEVECTWQDIYFLTKKLYKEALKTETDIYYLYSSPIFLGYIGTKLQKKAPTLYIIP